MEIRPHRILHLCSIASLAACCQATMAASVAQDCQGRGSSSGGGECTYRPVQAAFRYQIAGPIKATGAYLDPEKAKAEYGGVLAAGRLFCIDPVLVSQSDFVDDSAPGLWRPNLFGGKKAMVTYFFQVKPYANQPDCNQGEYVSVTLSAFRPLACPFGWSLGWDLDANVTYCKRPARSDAEQCGGNPITLPLADKVQREVDYGAVAPFGLTWWRTYRSAGKAYPPLYGGNLWDEAGGFGQFWTHAYDKVLHLPADATLPMWVRRHDRPLEYFSRPAAPYPSTLAASLPTSKSRATALSPSEVLYYTVDNEIERYIAGQLVSTHSAGGRINTLSYDGIGRLSTVSDTFGRTLQFTYSPDWNLQQVLDPAGGSISYKFKDPLDPDFESIKEGRYLKEVIFPDGARRGYRTGTPSIVEQEVYPYLLKGVDDELGVPFSTFTYAGGLGAASTEHAGGVNRWTISGNSLIDPLGTAHSYSYSTVAGRRTLTGQSQPAGSGCAAASSSLSYDANGNVASRNDFNNQRICYANDLARNIESARVEGLAGGTTCSSVTGTGATLPAGARKVSTQWHPDWRLASKVAEPGRITTYVYNGQPDPFAGGTTASCAPANALLPDGKPIAVLCRQVEQATTDANGSQGFGATLQAGVANREQKWTYNQYGQVLTHDGARTDVSDITTYAYYSDTSFTGTGSAAVGHTQGDLQSITNPAGQVTQYTQYDKHGQLLESIDPNGVVTTNTYDLRQRLLSTTVGGQTTSYTYDLAGQLKRITRPDASYIGFEHDPAHRQTAVYDNLGNRIEYTLDNAGNRIAENVKDTGGALRRQLARSIDALGRVQQSTGRE